ncbi:glycosyltransferase family 2 protein [Pseudomonas citronellolis]|uniref:glycosyltransferase family 2 protein n=1 Tax=Pseudomonas citronellolis TaxID=53408 RepID=UPI0023E37161|nr:glycosyltransferase [Pseudomonas citronellolis]MDF3933328.1 glycosyltransferase [Pseudomonas citronellolis]
MPKVSIVLPVYKGAAHLGECLNALLQQSFREFETLLIDDCSTDNSPEVIQSFLHDTRIRVFQNPVNLGTASTTNLGHRLARGEYIANLPEVLLQYRAHPEQQSGNPVQTLAITSRIRQRVINEFFPALTHSDAQQVEPLLRWHNPPALSRDFVEAGLALLPQLRAHEPSRHGESRDQRDGFLQACERRWRVALESL